MRRAVLSVAVGLAALVPAAAAQTIPGLENYSLPPSGPVLRPPPVSTPEPQPQPQPTPAGTPRPAATAASTPRPSATPTERQRRDDEPRTTPTPKPVVTSTPEPVAPAPKNRPSTEPALPPVDTEPAPSTAITGQGPATWWWAAGAVGLALLSWLVLRRRRREPMLTDVPPDAADARAELPAPPPVPAPQMPRRTMPEPSLAIVLHPRRAGTNLSSAAVDYRIEVHNRGAGDARDVRLAIFMLTASHRQQADVAQLFAKPIDRPAVAPFELEPGAFMEVSGMALLKRDALNVLTIAGKPWFVPVVAIKIEYRWGDSVGAAGTVTAVHLIGIDRGEGEKLAPFRLDAGPRMHVGVSERRVA